MKVIHRPRTTSGFTLPELLIAAISSAFVMLAVASGMVMFGEHVEAARAEADTAPEAAVALMSDMVRHAWWVEQPSPSLLEVADAQGAVTRFELAGSSLHVIRPSGASGVLLEGVDSLELSTRTVARLREAEPLSEPRTWWSAQVPDVEAEVLALEGGLPVGLGFTMASAVPDDLHPLEDVAEHATSATLETLSLALSFVQDIPVDPNDPVAGESTGSAGIGAASGDGKGNGKKVTICHVPPGNPDNAHTLEVGESAVDAHLAHGDTLGPCSAEDEPVPGASTTLFVELFRARAPDDARPVGEALGAVSIPATYLPLGSASWVLTATGGHDEGDGHDPAECGATTPDGKVVMCHVPPGNPGNAHAITIAPAAVAAHLAHGDYYGRCGDHGDGGDVFTLDVTPPAALVDLNLTPLNHLVEPGVAYTLVLSLAGPGMVQLASVPLASSQHSGVAQSAQEGGALLAQAAVVPFHLTGVQRITQTERVQAVNQVAISLAMESGDGASGSASVTSQTAVPGPWAGVVPGQLGGDAP